MAIQTANLGAAPSGAGGDTFRSAATKFNENFSNNAHAASRLVGTQAGNVMEVGAFGLGTNGGSFLHAYNDAPKGNGFIAYSDLGFTYGIQAVFAANGTGIQIISAIDDKTLRYRHNYGGVQWTDYVVYTSQNAAKDPNGFLKAASPIVSLYADKIELNEEAQQQNIEFEKLGTGDYLIKGSSGFAQDGWYIETPRDANGNLLVAVVYEQLENGDISVKTYDYMLNKKGRIVADTETPLDIPENRWIGLRLQELPQPEVEVTEPITPPDFQPTGLAQAVATVMESYHDPEQ